MKSLHEYTNEQIQYKNFSENVRIIKETKAGKSYSKYSCTNKNGITFYEVPGMQGITGSAVMGFINGDRARPTLFVGATKPTVVKTSFTIYSTVNIILTWNDNSTNETGFTLERKKGVAGSYSTLVSLSANTVTYTNENVLLDDTYYYRVKAYNASGDSAYSNVVST